MSIQARWWLALAGVVVLVIAAAVVVVRWIASPPADQSAPKVSSSPTSARNPANPVETSTPNSADAGVRLPGAGDAVMVVQTGTGIYQFHLDTGQVIATSTPVLEQFSSFVAGDGWVIFKTVDNDSGVVVDGRGASQRLPAGLKANGRLILTSHNDVWLVPEDSTNGFRSVARYGIDGRRIGTATIHLRDELGIPRSDQAGDMMITTATAAFKADPAGIRPISSGTVLGLNAERALSWDCDDQARCDPYLTDRATGRRTRRSHLHDTLRDVYRAGLIDDYNNAPGLLSPDNTHLAIAAPGQDQAQPWPVVVTNLTTGRSTVLPGSLTGDNGNVQFAWTPNSRYLLAITDNVVRVFDARTGRSNNLHTLPGQTLQHLAIAGQYGE